MILLLVSTVLVLINVVSAVSFGCVVIVKIGECDDVAWLMILVFFVSSLNNLARVTLTLSMFSD